jgi:hypothetical protein
MGAVTLAAYLVVAFVAWLVDRGPADGLQVRELRA